MILLYLQTLQSGFGPIKERQNVESGWLNSEKLFVEAKESLDIREKVFSYFGLSSHLDQPDLIRARVDLLFEQAHLATFVVLFNSIVLVAADLYFRAQVPSIWLLAALLLVTARFCSIWNYKIFDHPDLDQICDCGRAYVSLIILTAVLFAIAGIVFFDPINTTYQTFLVFVVGGTAGGAVTMLSAIPKLAKWYNAISLTPILFACVVFGDEFSLVVATLVFVLLLTMLKAAARSERAFTQALSYQIEQHALAALSKERRELEQDLHIKLNASNGELVRALESAQVAAQAKNAFLSTMGHELRTPLNGVIGMTDLVLDTALTDEQRGYLDLVQMSAQALLRSINDVLDYANLEAGKILLKEKEFSLHDLMSEISNFYQFRAEQAGIDLHLVVEDSFPFVCLGDVSRIAQVLNQLVDNAIKFSERGSIVLVLVLPDYNPGRDAINVTFAVADTGIGIDSSKDAIIGSFTQGEKDFSSRRYGGSGLGLAIADRLLKLLGAELHMKSHPGVGSRFYFTLKLKTGWPTTEGKIVASQSGELPLDLEKTLKRILVAEDNIVNQRLYKAILGEKGFEVTFASNGREACQFYREGQFDLILMDCQMPIMDGFLATRQIRAAERSGSERVPILALTSFGERDAKELCLKAGMDDFIAKPVTGVELIARVQDYLAKKQKSSSTKAPGSYEK